MPTLQRIQFTVLGTPVGKGRPRACIRGSHAAVYTSAKTAAAEQSFLAQALPHKPAAPLTVPVNVAITCRCPIPKSWPKFKRAQAMTGLLRPTGRPDIDNVAKLVLDALNGVFFADDQLVVSLYVNKIYAETPQTTVSISVHQEGALL